MSNFGRLEGYRITLVSSHDPAIYWKKTPFKKDEYQEDLINRVRKLVPTTGSQFIEFHCHFPQPDELSLAFRLAKIDQGEDTIAYYGNDFALKEKSMMGLSAALLFAQYELACLCIDDISNLDFIPNPLKEPTDFGLQTLTNDARDPNVLPRIVLCELGKALFTGSKVTEEEKKPVELQHTGLMLKKNEVMGTTARSVVTLSEEKL